MLPTQHRSELDDGTLTEVFVGGGGETNDPGSHGVIADEDIGIGRREVVESIVEKSVVQRGGGSLRRQWKDRRNRNAVSRRATDAIVPNDIVLREAVDTDARTELVEHGTRGGPHVDVVVLDNRILHLPARRRDLAEHADAFAIASRPFAPDHVVRYQV